MEAINKQSLRLIRLFGNTTSQKVPPVAVLIKKAIGIEKGSGKPNKDKVAKITKAQVKEIAEQKEHHSHY